jgi:hypothetical protein
MLFWFPPARPKTNRHFFSADDDHQLRLIKASFPSLSWNQITEQMPGFTARQLRERWSNYLAPSINTASWTPEEDDELLRLYTALGPCWGVIGGRMGGRSAPDIKNRYQSVIHRLDPDSRRPRPRRDRRSVVSKSKASPVQAVVLELPPLLPKQQEGRKEGEQPPTPGFSIRNILA